MRLLTLLLLALSAPCAIAQTAPEALSPTPEARPWRVYASGGVAGPLLSFSGIVGVERQVWGPVGVGARAAYYSNTGFFLGDDAGGMSGASGETFASVSTADRPLRLHASLGGGVAVLDYYSGGLVFECDTEEVDPCPATTSGSFEGTRGYAVASVGADVALTPAFGIGAEVRAAIMASEANVSSFALGLRLRL